MKTKATPAKKANVVYLLLKAYYGECEQDVRCERYKTLRAAKAAIRDEYKRHISKYESEEDAADCGDNISLQADGMGFSAVYTGDYRAVTWAVEVLDLDAVIE